MNISDLLNSEEAEPSPAALKPAVSHSAASSALEALQEVRSSPQWIDLFGLDLGGAFIKDLTRAIHALGEIVKLQARAPFGDSASYYVRRLLEQKVARIQDWDPRETRSRDEVEWDFISMIQSLNDAIGGLADDLKMPRAELGFEMTVEQRQRQHRAAQEGAAESEELIHKRLEQLKQLDSVVEEIEDVYAECESHLSEWRAPEGTATAQSVLAAIALAMRQVRANGERNILKGTVRIDLNMFAEAIKAIKVALDCVRSWSPYAKDGISIIPTAARELKQKFNVIIANIRKINTALDPKNAEPDLIPQLLTDQYQYYTPKKVSRTEQQLGKSSAMSKRRANIYGLL